MPFDFLIKPVTRLTRGPIRLGQRIWAFVGRLGLALRQLLVTLIWRPLLIVSAPLRWLHRVFLHRPLGFIWLSLRTFLAWFITQALPGLVKAIARRSGRFLARQIRLGRRWLHSNWLLWRARLWVRLRRPEPPELAIYVDSDYAPAHLLPRLNPFTTALVTTSVVLLATYLTNQARQPLHGPAELESLETQSAAIYRPSLPTPTPLPSPTPAPIPTAQPVMMSEALAAMQADTTLGAEADQASRDDPVERIADPLSQGGSVAFSLDLNGNSDIYALTIGRAEPVRLTADPAPDRDPTWSPDGKRLAFASHRDGNWEIYVLEVASGRLSRLTDDPAFDGGPSWSPDGQWLVFESYRQDNLDLYIVAADGSGDPMRLTEDPAPDFSPTWAPGGRHVAFTSWRSGNQDIFILSLDAPSDAQAGNVTRSPDQNEDHPAFAPDGSRLAYFDDSAGFELVYALPLANYAPAGPAVTVGQGRHPSWSPEGNALVYVYDTGQQNYLIAGSVDAWSVAPQAYTTSGRVDDLSWTGRSLPRAQNHPFDEPANAGQSRLYEERVNPPESTEAPYLLWRVEVDAPSPYLNDRVDESFNALRQRVIELAGWDFLGTVDNMYASLAVKPLPGETSQSWNKAGRAFDFYYRHALAPDPQVEVVREDRGTETYWRIYLRAAAQDGSQGEPLRQRSWDFNARYDSDPQYYVRGGKVKDNIPAGYYLDFTALAEDYGWQRVPALDNWRNFFQGIRYWHFENRQGLGWKEAMLEIYTPYELEAVFGTP